MKILAIAVLATVALSGCVVAPVGPYDETYPVTYGPNYVGPQFYWEPSVSLWYSNRGGQRYYQPRGWSHPQYGQRGPGGFHGHR